MQFKKMWVLISKNKSYDPIRIYFRSTIIQYKYQWHCKSTKEFNIFLYADVSLYYFYHTQFKYIVKAKMYKDIDIVSQILNSHFLVSFWKTSRKNKIPGII